MVTVNHTGAALGTPEDATMKTTIKPTISCLRTEIPNTPSPHTSQNHLSSSVPDSRKAITTSSHRERLKPSPYANGSSSAPPRSTIPESPDIHDQDKLRQSSCASVPRKSTDMAKYAEPLSTHQQHETELAQRANWEQSCHAFSKACPAEDKPALVENMVMSARTDNVLTVNKGGTLTSESVDTPKEASQARGEIPCTAEDDDDNQRAMSSIESQSLNRIPGLLPATVITLNQQPLLSSIVLGEQEEQSSPRLPKHSPATTRPVLPITATSPKMNMDKLRSDSPTTEMRRLQHHRKAKAYTMRELAQIALVAANGQRLTTAAVVSWLSATFSHLRTRDLEWQARVRSALSTFDEFSGEKISGTLGRGNKKSYAFSSSQTRTRYEREFPQFSNSAVASTGTSLRSLSVQSSVPTSLVPTGPNDEDFNSETSSTHSMQSKVASPLNKLRTNAIGQYSMPFQRVGNKDLLPPSHLVQNSRRVAKYCDIIMDDQQNAGIENMTEIEKWQRIAEIKARPSRKQNFGRNHKLAHKRRHRLQDVHDERDGAWTRPFTIKERTLFDVLASDIDMEIDGSQTLRDIFSLPVYAIPMNDGQSELAFRDGSMVSMSL